MCKQKSDTGEVYHPQHHVHYLLIIHPHTHTCCPLKNNYSTLKYIPIPINIDHGCIRGVDRSKKQTRTTSIHTHTQKYVKGQNQWPWCQISVCEERVCHKQTSRPPNTYCGITSSSYLCKRAGCHQIQYKPYNGNIRDV